MSKRIISLLLVLIMMFSAFIQPVLAIDATINESEIENVIEIATASNAEKEIKEDDAFNSSLITNTEETQENKDFDIVDDVINNNNHDTINQENNFDFLDELDNPIESVFTESNVDEIENAEDTNNLAINDNISAIIPNNSDNMLNDLGILDGFVADISKISTFSLRGSNNVVLKTPQYEDGTELSVVHFIESIYHISDDSIVLNVSDYSNSSKELLEPAITAYQEYSSSNEDFVAIEIFDTVVEDGLIEFETNSFSIFAVGQAFLNTFEFYVDDELVNTQYIIGNSNGEGVLLEPETPTKDNALFKGWKVENSNKYQEFGTIEVNMSEHTTIRLYADLEEIYHVYFYYEAREGADILETLSGKPGDIIYTEKVDYPVNLDKHVISWHTDIECTSPDVTEVIIGNENIVLYPKVETGFWVTFYTNGGSYIDPMFYGKNEIIIAPAEPQKDGYQFIGWLDKNNDSFEFNGQLLTQSCILYASWQPLQVEYTVQVMLQDPNILTDYNPVDTASFKKYIEVNSEVFGASITETELDTLINGLSNSNYFKKNLDFFYLNTEKTQVSKITAAGDGSSVLYVYYDRYPYIINFYLNEADYTSKNLYKSITGYFDAELAFADWPIPLETEVPSFISWYNPGSQINSPWTGYYNYSINYLTFDTDNNEWTFDLYAITSSSCTWEISYYLQNLNPDGTVTDVGYTLENDHQMKPNLNALTPTDTSSEIFKKNWSKLEIDTDLGVISDMLVDNSWSLYNTSYHASNKAFSFWDDPIAGFTLVAFTMDSFDSNGKKGDEFAVYRVDPRTQAHFAYVDDNITVEGSKPMDSGRWYAISSGIQLKNIFGHIYCRYLRNSYNLEFVADGQTIDEFDVYFETDLSLDKFVTVYEKLNVPEGYRFEGWYTAPDLSDDSKFDLTKNKMPANDVKLYAKYVPKIVDIYVHITLDGSDTIIEGFNSFTVKYGSVVQRERVDELRPSVELPEGAIWYGWYEKTNVGGEKELLVPFNFDRQLIKDLVLYPFYSYMDPTKVFYDLNGGTGTTPIDIYNYAVGKGAVVLDCPDIIAPEGKIFLGWNTKEDGTGLTFRPNDIMRIAEKNPVLYALYGDVPDGPYDVSIKYINTVSGEEVLETYQLYNTVFIKDQNVFTIPIHRTYIFKEFSTKSDGTGISFSPNDEVYLTTEGENILYAIYEKVNSTSINIPIIKHFKDFQPTDELFTINGYLSNETGDLLSEPLGVICFKYQGNETESMNLEMVLDLEFFEPNNDYYIKIFENPGESMILYDNNYYLVKFTMENITPTILSIEKYRKDGEIIESFEFEGSLEFANVLTLEADRLPDMGGTGTSNLRMIGLIVVSVGYFILLYYKGKYKKSRGL